MKNTLKVLSLFSGIGGADIGLEKAGMKTIAFCEIDKTCQKVLKKHWPDVPILGDIKNVYRLHIYHREDYLEEVDEKGERLQNIFIGDGIDVIVGGFPCTDLSVAGKKKGFVDEEGKETRSGLWNEYKRLIKEIRPRWVIVENVPNLRNLGLGTVIKDLSSIGYVGSYEIISARSVGAPHLRERIWIVARLTNSNSQQLRFQSNKFTKRGGETLSRVNGEERNSTDSNDFRFWPAFTSEESKQEWWTETSFSVCSRYETKPPSFGVDDGLSGKLDRPRKERMRQLGNALIPGIMEIIGRRIIEIESKDLL
jgi:DNA (cytosine-5)-methyltransferase 1